MLLADLQDTEVLNPEVFEALDEDAKTLGLIASGAVPVPPPREPGAPDEVRSEIVGSEATTEDGHASDGQ